MIHFDFIVSDEDADLIFACINAEICNLKNHILLSRDAFHTQAINMHIDHLNGLRDKMTNSKV